MTFFFFFVFSPPLSLPSSWNIIELSLCVLFFFIGGVGWGVIFFLTQPKYRYGWLVAQIDGWVDEGRGRRGGEGEYFYSGELC